MAKKLSAGIQVGFGRENWEQAVDFIVEAEKLGVGYAWSAEAWGSDGISPLAYVAARTSKTSLAPASSRRAPAPLPSSA
ncbi:MAG: LLM class flavin-dependent oxidoreductase [Dehalococcoidia bacterium]